jgi:hypothetical protein
VFRRSVQSDFSRIAAEQRENPPKLELALLGILRIRTVPGCGRRAGIPEITRASSFGRVRASERE